MNTWRSPGMAKQFGNVANNIYGPYVANTQFTSTPGRLLRNRWSSVDEGEERIILCDDRLPVVFKAALGKSLKEDALHIKSMAGKGGGVGDKGGINNVSLTEDEQFKLDQKTYRTNSVLTVVFQNKTNYEILLKCTGTDIKENYIFEKSF